MKKYIFLLPLIILFTGACSNKMSLQKYFVSRAEQEEFLSVTVPASMLKFKEGLDTDENVKALNSFKRLNILIYKNDTVQGDVDQEKEIKIIDEILGRANFKELMSVNVQGNSAILSFTGEHDNIDELVGFGHNEQGFVLARITGKDMNVKEIGKLVSAIDFDESDLTDLANMDINFD